MILMWLVIIPFLGGLAAWYSERFHPVYPRWISLASLITTFVLMLSLWGQYYNGFNGLTGSNGYFLVVDLEWIPQIGARLHLAMDGLSLLLVILSAFLGIAAVTSSWTEIKERVGFFHLNLMWTLTGIIGVFLSLDLFLFYFFWELMLVPMFFLIYLWGHENRRYASFKFFIFTQAGGLLMLLSILGLYFIHGHHTGIYTFDYTHLLGTPMSATTGLLLMSGFFMAFAVKLPVVPFHTWLPDAHTEAPTAGSVILAGLLLKTGAYGLIRFAVPLFPNAASSLAMPFMILSVIGIIYGAIMAFAQTDLKRLVAYTSVSHMGFVLLGISVWNELALQGAVMQIVCHGIATGALFIIVGALQERIHTREMGKMGGLWTTLPRMGAVGLFFALASLGLPGLGNFIGEFLVLLGSFRVNIIMTSLAAIGLVIATVYSLWFIQKVFHGKAEYEYKIPDLGIREMAVIGAMIIVIVWLGLYPQPVLNTSKQGLNNVTQGAVGITLTTIDYQKKGGQGIIAARTAQAYQGWLSGLSQPRRQAGCLSRMSDNTLSSLLPHVSIGDNP